jgi:anti-anti-sigma regulatory factor
MAALAASPVVLPAVFDLDALDAVRDQLLDAVEASSVEVRAEGVGRVATNALLMLLCAAQTATANGHTLSLTGASPPVLAAIDRLGLGDAFARLVRE